MGNGTLDEARERLRLARLRTLLFALLLVGLPLGISISLIAGRHSLQAMSGSQPGGWFRGRIVLADGNPAVGVPVQLLTLSADASASKCAEVASGSDGHFALQAPPHEGKYAVRAGGGELRHVWREVSFIDRKGAVTDPGELELRLERGCSLTVEFVRVSERYADSGRFDLTGRVRGGSLFGLMATEVSRSEDFEGGRIEIGDLPPFDGKLQVFLSNGDQLALDLALGEGAHLRRIEL